VSDVSPAAGQKNGRSNRKRNFFNEVSYKVSGVSQVAGCGSVSLIDKEILALLK